MCARHIAYIFLFIGLCTQTNAAHTLEALHGNWVNQSTLEQLQQKKTLLESEPEMLQIKADTSTLIWTNFHEGVQYTVQSLTQAQGLSVLMLQSYTDDVTAINYPVDEQHATAATLKLSFKAQRDQQQNLIGLTFLDDTLIHNQDTLFVRLSQPLAEYTNEVLLAGQYQDKQSRKTYIFSQDGVATWPNTKFAYEVALDLMEADCDYLRIKDAGDQKAWQGYGFKWLNGQLNLYQLQFDQDTPISCAATPFAQLIPQ